jgi:hypothetical protein
MCYLSHFKSGIDMSAAVYILNDVIERDSQSSIHPHLFDPYIHSLPIYMCSPPIRSFSSRAHSFGIERSAAAAAGGGGICLIRLRV